MSKHVDEKYDGKFQLNTTQFDFDFEIQFITHKIEMKLNYGL